MSSRVAAVFVEDQAASEPSAVLETSSSIESALLAEGQYGSSDAEGGVEEMERVILEGESLHEGVLNMHPEEWSSAP